MPRGKTNHELIAEAVAAAEREGRILSNVGVWLPGPAPDPAGGEKEFQAAVEREARRLGWKVYHTRDSRKSAAGFPDLVALRAGRLVVSELKVKGNEPTADQLTWLEEWRLVPAAEVFVWRPENWPEIVRVLT